MVRPAIGICTAIEQARWGAWDRVVNLLPSPYASKIRAAGGIPLLLPPPEHPREELAVSEVVERLDALMLAGGSDLDPGSYGQSPHPTVGPTWPQRDRFEIELAREALRREVPVLGVCRGMQALNVALGGALVQHLPDELGDERHVERHGTFSEHDVRLQPGSLAARAAGGDRISVKSHHHQGVSELGEGLVATGWDDAGTIEAIELPGHRFALGILWHPEEEDGEPAVIAALIEAARTRP
jgi:putative glutamine amidotransferase